MTDKAEITTFLWDRGTLMDLNIGKPTFHVKLRHKDILLPSIDSTAIHLGHKKLLPRAALGKLSRIESEARKTLYAKSITFPVSRARFVFYRSLPSVLAKLKEIKIQWTSAVSELVENYTRLKDEQLDLINKQNRMLIAKELEKFEGKIDSVIQQRTKELNEWAEEQRILNSVSAPTENHLRDAFRFDWRMFKISSTSGLDQISSMEQDELLVAQEKIKEDMQKWVSRASTDMYKALGDAASKSSELLTKQGKLNPKNLRPLVEAFETFKSIDFTGNSEFRKSVDKALEGYFRRNENGDIDYDASAIVIENNGTEFQSLLASVGQLAVQDVAANAGLTSLREAGEYKRILDL